VHHQLGQKDYFLHTVPPLCYNDLMKATPQQWYNDRMKTATQHAIEDGTTAYRKSVKTPNLAVLKPGRNNKKLGWMI